MTFTYTTDTITGTGQTQYIINVPNNFLCDILVIGGGGGGTDNYVNVGSSYTRPFHSRDVWTVQGGGFRWRSSSEGVSSSSFSIKREVWSFLQIQVLQKWLNEVLARRELVTKVTEKEMTGKLTLKGGQRSIRSPIGFQLSYSTLPTSLLHMSLTRGSRRWLSTRSFSRKSKEVFDRTRVQTSTSACYTV